MEIKKRKTWKNALASLKEKTEICRVCFNHFPIDTFRTAILKEPMVCEKCYREFHPYFHSFKIDKIKVISLYKYDEFIKEKLYLLKGCFDIELAPIFLSPFSFLLKIKYFGFYIVPVPSYFKDDETRGFNHVVEIFKRMKLPFIFALKKISPIKQSNQNIKNRTHVKKRLNIIDGERISGKKILLVDDVITTGSTMKACLSLLEKYNPKKIEVLVLSQVKKHEIEDLKEKI